MTQPTVSEETSSSMLLEMIQKTEEAENIMSEKIVLKESFDGPSFSLNISQMTSYGKDTMEMADEGYSKEDDKKDSTCSESESLHNDKVIESVAPTHDQANEIEGDVQADGVDIEPTGLQTMLNTVDAETYLKDTVSESCQPTTDPTESELVEKLIKKSSFLNLDEDAYETPSKFVYQQKQPMSVAKPIDEIITKMQRPERIKIASEALCSPYYQRKVVMDQARTLVESNISGYAFRGEGEIWYKKE